MEAIVRDIQKAQMTPEKEVYQEQNFVGKAIDTLGTLARSIASGSGEKKNYANLEKRTEQFFDEMQAKGLKADDSEFIDKYKKFRTDAFNMRENYTPTEVDDFFKDYFGEEFMKPTKTLISADAQKEIDMNDEAMLIGAQMFPGLKPSEQTAQGRRIMLSQASVDAIEKLLPSMSKEEREQILDGSYRDAFLTAINLDFQKILDNNGGIVTTQIVNAYKDDMTARLKMAGFPSVAAQRFVDNAMSLYASLAERHAGDTEKLAKDTENIKQVFTNQLQMAAYAAPIALTNKDGSKTKTTVGALAASLGVTKLADLPPEFLANHLEILGQVSEDPSVIDFARLPDDLKGIVMSRQGLFRIARDFEDNSPGKKALEAISEKKAEEYLSELSKMDREELAKNTNYNTAYNAYVTSHEIVTPEETTPEEQKRQFQVFADAAGKSNDKFLREYGFILLDDAGNPHYIRKEALGNDSFEDATQAGEVIEFLDNDAVDARTKLFGSIRQMIATASKFMPMSEAIDIWNTEQIRNSTNVRRINFNDAVKKAGADVLTNPVATALLSKQVGVDVQDTVGAATMTDAKIQEIKDNFRNGNYAPTDPIRYRDTTAPEHHYKMPVTNAKLAAYDDKNGSLVFTSVMNAVVKSPIVGKILDISGNPFTDVYRVVMEEDGNKNKWTISGTKMENGFKKVGNKVSVGDKIGVLKGSKPAIGISITNATGSIIDPRQYFAAPVPPQKPLQA